MYTFTRDERLKSRTLISRLFREGHSYVAYPVRVVWLPVELPDVANGVRAQMTVSVPKRVFKTAVSRNRLKRLVREAYRLHKHELYAKLAPLDQYLALMLVYIPKEELPFAAVEEGIKKMIRKFPAEPPDK